MHVKVQVVLVQFKAGTHKERRATSRLALSPNQGPAGARCKS